MLNPDDTGVRGSTCWSVFMVGAGAPEGVRGPWAKVDATMKDAIISQAVVRISFMGFSSFG